MKYSPRQRVSSPVRRPIGCMAACWLRRPASPRRRACRHADIGIGAGASRSIWRCRRAPASRTRDSTAEVRSIWAAAFANSSRPCAKPTTESCRRARRSPGTSRRPSIPTVPPRGAPWCGCKCSMFRSVRPAMPVTRSPRTTAGRDSVAERFADRVIAQAAEHVAGLEHMVLARHVTSPADLARSNPNAGPGDHAAGHNALSQSFTQRPIPAASRRICDRGVGSLSDRAATWPGPGVSGSSGRAVARRLLNQRMSPAHGTKLLDDVLSAAVRNGDLPYVVAAVGTSTHTVWSGTAGDMKPGEPAAMDTVFRVMSMSKGIGATAAAILADRGALDWDAPVDTVLPRFAELQVLEGFDSAGRPILRDPRSRATIRQLATHTSGLAYELWDASINTYLELDRDPADRIGSASGPEMSVGLRPGAAMAVRLRRRLAGARGGGDRRPVNRSGVSRRDLRAARNG